jgi:4-hydroxythreonine-4-phosphate dehydrogenase
MPKKITKKPRIAITLGDPSGIGPEITAKALAKASIKSLADFILIGDASVYLHYQKHIPKTILLDDLKIIQRFSSPKNLSIIERGNASYAYLQRAIRMIKSKDADAIVTAPISKTAVIASGITNFKGHTEMLAEAFQIENVEMMFTGGPFKTIIATRHIPLSQVASAITSKGLISTIRLADHCLKDTFKISHPRIAVCGVNPHAGEEGKIGREEIDFIIPAIQAARKEGIVIEGPIAADTLFIPFNAQKYDLIIAMYHDQGLAPIKALYFTKLVNLTIGLPFIRTSTAHGTAEDIAGKNKADPSSMIEAIKLACELTRKQ